jgi:hypothetical protein
LEQKPELNLNRTPELLSAKLDQPNIPLKTSIKKVLIIAGDEDIIRSKIV